MNKLRFIPACLAALLTACADSAPDWEKIMTSRQLRFVTTESPMTYYQTPSGPAGLEYELAQRFSDFLGINLELILADNTAEAISMVAYNKALIAGAAITPAGDHDILKSGPAYYTTSHQLVYRQGDTPPGSLRDFTSGILNVPEAQYRLLSEKYPDLRTFTASNTDTASLLKAIQQRKIQSTIANAKQIEAYRYLYPDIRVAFDVANDQPVTWLYNRQVNTLDGRIHEFFDEITGNGVLNRLTEKYFGHFVTFDYIDTVTFLKRLETRLPQYRGIFENTGKQFGLDWTLLAAMSYQESHWSPDARSPTGVRGLMMLTRDTARHIGIEDRLDPEQSIQGGARYYKLLLEMIPARISEPDRTWFTLAAYNIGFRHLENARVITQADGGNPDLWVDVKRKLISISTDKKYKQLQSGQIRWYEPVVYVRNIRRYMDVLRWYNNEQEKGIRQAVQYPLPTMNLPAL